VALLFAFDGGGGLPGCRSFRATYRLNKQTTRAAPQLIGSMVLHARIKPHAREQLQTPVSHPVHAHLHADPTPPDSLLEPTSCVEPSGLGRAVVAVHNAVSRYRFNATYFAPFRVRGAVVARLQCQRRDMALPTS